MAQFFIDRPIFAWVISIVIMLAGALSISTLPLEQYPDIAPPRVSINATYTGASAKTVEDSVTQVIEQQLKGLDNLLYIQSTSNASGGSRTSLTFNAGADIDVAQMQVQNKLQQAMSRLPQEVQARGVTVTKGGNDFLLIVSMYSADGSASAVDVGDYISSNLVDVISRIDGVGEVQTLGTGYAMRIWLDPDKLRKYALMPLTSTRPWWRRTRRSPPASSAPCPPPRSSSSTPPSPRAANCARSTSSGRWCCAPRPTARWCGCRTWRASSSAPRT